MMFSPPPPDLPPNCSMVTSPLFHVSALHAAAVMLLAGGVRSVWLTGRFDPDVALQVIESEGVTSWGFTGTVLHRLVHHPKIHDYDLSTLRTVGGGGSPIAPSLLQKTQEVIPHLRESLSVGYGSTETAALLTSNVGPELAAHPDSVGRPNATVGIDIRDPEGNSLPLGEEGEVCARGPMIMPGYWHRPDDTAAAFWPHGWLRMGDIGRLVDGRLYLASRKRDLIFRGGENVYPVEIEHRLEAHPDVLEAAIVGVDHAELGQEVKAYVVPMEGATLDADALAAWVRRDPRLLQGPRPLGAAVGATAPERHREDREGRPRRRVRPRLRRGVTSRPCPPARHRDAASAQTSDIPSDHSDQLGGRTGCPRSNKRRRARRVLRRIPARRSRSTA